MFPCPRPILCPEHAQPFNFAFFVLGLFQVGCTDKVLKKNFFFNLTLLQHLGTYKFNY